MPGAVQSGMEICSCHQVVWQPDLGSHVAVLGDQAPQHRQGALRYLPAQPARTQLGGHLNPEAMYAQSNAVAKCCYLTRRPHSDDDCSTSSLAETALCMGAPPVGVCGQHDQHLDGLEGWRDAAVLDCLDNLKRPPSHLHNKHVEPWAPTNTPCVEQWDPGEVLSRAANDPEFDVGHHLKCIARWATRTQRG